MSIKLAFGVSDELSWLISAIKAMR